MTSEIERLRTAIEALTWTIAMFLEAAPVRAADTAQRRTTRERDAYTSYQQDKLLLLRLFFQEHEEDPPEHFTPGEIGSVLGCDVRAAGVMLRLLAPGIRNIPHKGYPASAIYTELATDPDYAGQDKRLGKLLMFFQEHEEDPPEHFTPGEIASVLGCDVRSAVVLVRQLFPTVKNLQPKGYPASAIYTELDDLRAQI